MKKIIITLALIWLAQVAQAQSFNPTHNFTNACNYKMALQGVTFDVHPKTDESGDWVGNGIVTYTTTATPTNYPAGMKIRRLKTTYHENIDVYVSNSFIRVKSGSNDVVKVGKVLKDMARELGALHKAEFSQ